MRLCNFIVRDAIIPSLSVPVPQTDARDAATVRRVKEAVVREMVGALHAAGHFRAADVDEIVKAVLRREDLGTTGIGRHIAIPHSRHAAVDRLIGTLALSRDGLPFDSLDALRAAMAAEVPALGAEGLADYGWSAPKLSAVASGPVGYPVKDFYLTNPIARASETMQRCSAELIHGQSFAEAAE